MSHSRTFLPAWAAAITWLAVLAAAGASGAAEQTPQPGRTATLVVAASNSAPASKAAADFVCDGERDQEEINAAVRALPPAGGTVLLMEGVYHIHKTEGTLGGVIIDRIHVTLAGQGSSSRLIQAPDQNTNVVRIIGSGVGYITIRDLYVDANRDANPYGEGDPNISHDRFEYCGIKAYYREPGGPSGDMNHNITVRNCHVMNARRLGIMLEGRNMQVLDNVLGNAMSDSVEILTGPGIIRGNYVEITGRTHVALGTDRAEDIIMASNVVHVREGGDLDIAFRSWAGYRRHIFANNVVTVDAGGRCARAMDVRGPGAVITGNAVHTVDPGAPLLVTLSGGGAAVTGNLFENAIVEVNVTSDEPEPIVFSANIMKDSRVQVETGRVYGLEE